MRIVHFSRQVRAAPFGGGLQGVFVRLLISGVAVFLAVATGCGLTVVLRYFSGDIATNKTQNHIQRKNNSDLQ